MNSHMVHVVKAAGCAMFVLCLTEVCLGLEHRISQYISGLNVLMWGYLKVDCAIRLMVMGICGCCRERWTL